MGNYIFKEDLPIGQFGERLMVRFIDTLKHNNKKLIYSGTPQDFKDDKSHYDLMYQIHDVNEDGKVSIFSNGRIKFEVKTDFYQQDTGNMIIETKSWGKKSGISKSKSDYYIYFYIGLKEDNVWIIKTEKLKELLKDKKQYLVYGGDKGSDTLMYKIPRNEFIDSFKVFSFTDYEYNTIDKKVSKNQDKVVYYSDNLFMRKYDDDNIF